MKVRRVIAHARTVVFHFTIEEISGFLAKLLYAVAYVPPEARFRVRGGSLSLSRGGGALGDRALPWWRPWRALASRPADVKDHSSLIAI